MSLHSSTAPVLGAVSSTPPLLTLSLAIVEITKATGISRSTLYRMGVHRQLREDGSHLGVVHTKGGGVRAAAFRVPIEAVDDTIDAITEGRFVPPAAS
jgi:hypothetical protein